MRVRAYHGTPITSAGNVVLEALKGFDFCVSYFSPYQVEWVDKNAREWFGDNGIFSAWQKALKTSGDATFSREYFEGYYAWCRRWCLEGSGRCKWVVIPYPIGTATQELDAFIREWPSELRDFGVPVWHTDESIERAIMLLETHGRLCVGAVGDHRVIGSDAFCERMNRFWNAVIRVFGRPMPVHMFRSLQLLHPDWPWPFGADGFGGHDSAHMGRNHNRLKRYGERRIWAVVEKAQKYERWASERPDAWHPPLTEQHLW